MKMFFWQHKSERRDILMGHFLGHKGFVIGVMESSVQGRDG